MAAHATTTTTTSTSTSTSSWDDCDTEDLLQEMLAAMRVSTELAKRAAPGNELAFRYSVAAKLGIYVNSDVESVLLQLVGQVDKYLTASSTTAILVVSEVVTDIVSTVEEEIAAEEAAQRKVVEEKIKDMIEEIAAPEDHRLEVLSIAETMVIDLVEHVCELKAKAQRFRDLFEFTPPESSHFQMDEADVGRVVEEEEKEEFGVEETDFYHDRIKFRDAYAISYVERPEPTGRAPESVLKDHFIADIPIGYQPPASDPLAGSAKSSASSSSGSGSGSRSGSGKRKASKKSKNRPETPEEETKQGGWVSCFSCFT